MAETRLPMKSMKRARLCVLGAICLVLALADPSVARQRHRKGSKQAHPRHRVVAPAVRIPARMTPPMNPPEGPYASALLIEAETGTVLFEKHAADPRPPASLVKMMTALLAFEALQRGEIRLDQQVPISLAASRTGGSGILLKAGERLPFEDLLKAMIVASANGASVAIAEALAGSQPAMIGRMNQRARELAMTETAYRSVNGLPPRRGAGLPDVTSAHDLAILARVLLGHQEVFRYSSQPIVPIRNGTVYIRNTNHLVGHMEGADGLKTGYYRRAGFNLTATATRDGLRLIAVVMGCPTLQSRFLLAQELMEWGFAHFSKLKVVERGQPLAVDVRVSNGQIESVTPIAAHSASYLIRDGQRDDLRVTYQFPTTVSAPVAKHQELGEIIIRDRSQQVLEVIPAISPIDVRSGPLLH